MNKSNSNANLVRRDCIRFCMPARNFGEASVIGNGRLGAMIYGALEDECIAINENSVWSGGPQDADEPEACRLLPEIRRLLFSGNPVKAQELFYSGFTCKGKGTNTAQGKDVPYGCYQLLGNLRIHNILPGEPEQYSRTLDMSRAAVRVSFSCGGVSFERDYFCSMQDEAFLMKFSASQQGAISFDAWMDRPENYEILEQDGEFVITGLLPNGQGGGGVRYAGILSVRAHGGTLQLQNGKMRITGADTAEIRVTAATDMRGFLGRELENALAGAQTDMDVIRGMDYDTLFKRHVACFSPMYNKVCLMLPACEEDNLDIYTRLVRHASGRKDLGMLTLCFNFGRYLLLCSSRRNGIPSNLQGLWAEEIQTPWNGDWHINAQQMLYWDAEICNMSDQHLPYLRLAEKLTGPGSKTARAYYNCGGWVAHTCTNAWGFTSPGENADWGSTIGSGAWLCHHLWEHYLYTMDREYLEWAYPVMRESAHFYSDYLIEDPQHHWLITAPTSSPENLYYDEKGNSCAVCAGSTYDNELIRHLFLCVIQAAKILDRDEQMCSILKDQLDHLAPVQIGWDGRIMEWMEEYEEVLPYHRHLSHLWAVYPGYEITREGTPELAEAALKSVRKRKFTGPGWATAYRACIYARLRQPEEAYNQICRLTGICSFPNLMSSAFHGDERLPYPRNPEISGSIPTDKPFQMDANSGTVTAIALLLMDDKIRFTENNRTETTIYLLPALPKELPDGKISGLRAKGGFEVSVEWYGGQLYEASVTGYACRDCRVIWNGKEKKICLQPGETVKIHPEDFCSQI